MASLTEMLDVPDSKRYGFVRAVIAAIEAVMTLPAMPEIAVRIVSAVSGGGEGAYVRQRGGLPLRIEIAEQAEYPELTMAHEVAHYLDDCGFRTAGGWASEEEPRLEALRQGWKDVCIMCSGLKATFKWSPKRLIRFWRNSDGCDKGRSGKRCS